MFHSIALGLTMRKSFPPVAEVKSIRIILAIYSFYDYEVWQMEVKTVFINGK